MTSPGFRYVEEGVTSLVCGALGVPVRGECLEVCPVRWGRFRSVEGFTACSEQVGACGGGVTSPGVPVHAYIRRGVFIRGLECHLAK